ncbi:MAG TPA: hypothetical protein PLU87_09075 [Sedimentisphaerales bacterium]|nr:hypothetical protein [Sedimentisphaerales bacterium]HRS11136.1 hypothetical protein [Sedimentisphaerales bacterium]HRV47655.1 hypothetical protein [Sedimentisphaerales bacterium]
MTKRRLILDIPESPVAPGKKRVTGGVAGSADGVICSVLIYYRVAPCTIGPV